LHGGVLNFTHLSATGVAEIAEPTNLKGCPHTFVYIVSVKQKKTMIARLNKPYNYCIHKDNFEPFPQNVLQKHMYWKTNADRKSE
jgi:hypothetical protein